MSKRTMYSVLIEHVEEELAGVTIHGLDVTISTRGGSQRANGLTWDEMLGQVLSVFTCPRSPLYCPDVEGDVRREQRTVRRCREEAPAKLAAAVDAAVRGEELPA